MDAQNGMSDTAVDFVSGGMAGALSVTATQPLDTLRIRMQAAHLPAAPLAAATGGASLPRVAGGAAVHAPLPLSPPPRKLKAPVQLLACIVRKEGGRSLFRGMSFPLAASSLQHALLFQVYGSTLRLLQQSTPGYYTSSSTTTSTSTSSNAANSTAGPSLAHGFLAGSVAGFAQSLLGCPVEMLKIRMQLQTARPRTPEYMSAAHVLRGVLAKEGVRGLYRGITVTALRDTPSFGVYFASYLAIARWLEPGVQPHDASALTQVLAGGTAGCLSWSSVYPLDVIKSRVQAASGTRGRVGGWRCETWLHCAHGVWREGGARALWVGLLPTLARAFVMDAVTFLGYTNIVRLMERQGHGNRGMAP